MEWKWNRGRPCTNWLDRVEKDCNASSLELRDAKVICMDRQQRRNFVHDANDCVNIRICKVWPRIPSTRTNEGVDTDVVASAATGSLGEVKPTTDCLKPPFIDGAYRLEGHKSSTPDLQIVWRSACTGSWKNASVVSFCFSSVYPQR